MKEKLWWAASPTCTDQGSKPQPRYVPWLRTEPTTSWCTGQCSNYLSHLVRAHSFSSWSVVTFSPFHTFLPKVRTEHLSHGQWNRYSSLWTGVGPTCPLVSSGFYVDKCIMAKVMLPSYYISWVYLCLQGKVQIAQLVDNVFPHLAITFLTWSPLLDPLLWIRSCTLIPPWSLFCL